MEPTTLCIPPVPATTTHTRVQYATSERASELLTPMVAVSSKPKMLTEPVRGSPQPTVSLRKAIVTVWFITATIIHTPTSGFHRQLCHRPHDIQMQTGRFRKSSLLHSDGVECTCAPPFVKFKQPRLLVKAYMLFFFMMTTSS